MPQVIHVSPGDYDCRVLGSNEPVIVDFWADWCAPCHRLAPLLDEIAERYDGKAVVAKVNVDDAPELVERHGIRTVPTLLFVRGGEVVDRAPGVPSRARLDARVEALLTTSRDGDTSPTLD